MSYAVTIPVEFPNSAHIVYEALCDLSRHPEWNDGMISISSTGRMYEGLRYTSLSKIMGRTNNSDVEVVKMIEDQAIVLQSHAGLVTFRAVYELNEVSPESCKVICSLQFTFSKTIFKLAESTVANVAEERIRTDLETLRNILG